MNPNQIQPKMKVRTSPGLNSPKGMIVDQKFLDQRKANQIAYVYGVIPGHGGDVWWLLHEGCPLIEGENKTPAYDKKFIAPYSWMEFELYKE
jgi:hypothetical protein